MLRSHLILAFRHLVTHRMYAVVNVLGLGVAFMAAFFIVQYVAVECSYDRFHFGSERIYRVALSEFGNGITKNSSAKSYAGIYNFLNENVPEVEVATRFAKIPANTGFLFGYNNQVFNESGGVVNADANFFKVFPTLLVRGDVQTALSEPHSIVISESIARKVFGDRDPIGLQLDAISERVGAALTVTGILRDIPANSHLHTKFVAKLEDMWPEVIENKWHPTLIFNYARIRENSSSSLVAHKINTMLRDVASDVAEVEGAKAILQPLTSIHLRSHFSDEFEANGDSGLIFLLLGVGAVIILMSWVNHVNIETARFLRRSREVGVRRIIGSARSDLLLQFLTEFLLITLIAVGAASAGVTLTAAMFKDLTGVSLDLEVILQWPYMWGVIAFLLCGSTVAGVYPAMYVVRLRPVLALKGSFNNGKGRGFVRRPLLVLQFTASMILIALLLVVNQQLEYMRVSNKKLEVERVVALVNPVAYAAQEVFDKHSNYARLKQVLMQHPSIEGVETSSAIPGAEIGFTYVNLIKRAESDPFDPTRYKVMFVGDHFLDLYGIRLLAGRNFEANERHDWIDPWERKDWYKIIINEKACRALGFESAQQALHQVVRFQVFDEFQEHEIIGVMEDYHHEAVKKEILPVVLKPNFNSYQQVYYSIRLSKNTQPQQVIKDLNLIWKQVFPMHPFEYFFLDEYYDRQFRSEREFSSVFFVFAGIAVFIGCLGILSMVLFESNARIKELSIRRILGASPTKLMTLLSLDQVKCMFISCILSGPLVWIIARSWLAKYPVQVGVSVAMVMVPVLVIAIIIITISSLNVIRVSRINPVEPLKGE